MTPPDAGPDPDNIVAFEPRTVAGDWTAAELQRLDELSRKLEAQGAQVGAVYGVSDVGDPWCVITNETDEVLIHVARIGGRFVIHDAAADAVQDGDTLWGAFDRLLGEVWRDGREEGVVIPLHQAQALLALVAALVFEHAGPAGLMDRAPTPHDAHPAKAPEGVSLSAALSAALAETPHTARIAAASQGLADDPHHPQAAALRVMESPSAGPTAPASASPALLVAADSGAIHAASFDLAQPSPPGGPEGLQERHAGGPGKLLIGGHGGDHLVGGPGDDTLSGGGAGPGQLDVLSGGPGADRLVMANHTVAIGGAGHDTFMFSRPTTTDLHAQVTAPPAPAPPVQAGVILDFTFGDHLDFGPGGPATVVSVSAVSDVLAGLHGDAALAHRGVTPGQEVGFDLNGDGAPDILVLVAGPASASFTVGARAGDAMGPSAASQHPSDFVLTTHASLAGDFLFG